MNRDASIAPRFFFVIESAVHNVQRKTVEKISGLRPKQYAPPNKRAHEFHIILSLPPCIPLCKYNFLPRIPEPKDRGTPRSGVR